MSVGEATVDCRVAAVTGAEASLEPLNADDAALLPPASTAAELVFSEGGRLVMLRGAMYRVAGSTEIRFAERSRAGDVAEQRRRAARLPIALPATITRLDADGVPFGEPRKLVTRDVSIGGMAVVTGAGALPTDATLQLELVLADGSIITATGRVGRSTGELAGVRFEQVAPADRVRLAGFLAAQQRARGPRAWTKPPRG